MVLTVLKWGIPALTIAAIAGAFLTKKTFHVETMIEAPAEAVWAVLLDTRSYPEWNPVFVEANGDYSEGAKLAYKVRDPNGNLLEMTGTVVTITPSRELRQTGGVPGLLTFDHQWLLEPVDGGTKVIQHEIDRGLGLWFWNSDWIEPSYAKTLDALKKRVEQSAD
ncbi:SRPBCC domain-containing protein [Roseibium sp. MMSF_3544]|uniref:SRPBCC domain-containing protein n=1 Tax=unclassified Roseibium TaxID=2629323 RepID=UPI00273DC0CB|nr:SRPBCC domain-containing protein [Roseibium sp. MMSF_3544]